MQNLIYTVYRVITSDYAFRVVPAISLIASLLALIAVLARFGLMF